MPILINNRNEVIGSVVYEEYGTDDFILEFFTAKLDRKDDDIFDYSQRPLAQTWIVDYPLLAYKDYTPENKDIVIVHMAQDTP